MTPPLLACFLSLSLAATLATAASAPPSRPPPNLVLVMADDLGIAGVSAYGADRFATPEIDAIARRGLRFQHAFSVPRAREPIVVLTSDHGIALGEKDRWGKRALWERETRVPLIVRAPGVAPGRRCAEPAGLIDPYPTLLELAAHLEGRSLVPQFRDVAVARDPALTTFLVKNHEVRSREHRHIRYADGSEELYDHRIDPHEWRNVAREPGRGGLGVDWRHLEWFDGIR